LFGNEHACHLFSIDLISFEFVFMFFTFHFVTETEPKLTKETSVPLGLFFSFSAYLGFSKIINITNGITAKVLFEVLAVLMYMCNFNIIYLRNYCEA
jgi:hypothetical protein